MAKETPAHVRIADQVLAKVKKPVRDKLAIDSKASYSAIRDGDTWLLRVTAKLVEANRKRITPEQLESAGLHEVLKDDYHRAHHLGAAPASGDGDDEPTPIQGAGVEEIAHAVEVAAKKPTAAKKS